MAKELVDDDGVDNARYMQHPQKTVAACRDDEREVARSMGTGFQVPKTLAPKPKKPKKSVTKISVSGAIGRQEESATVLSY